MSSNFERLLWFIAFDVYGQGSLQEKRSIAGSRVKEWQNEFKTKGGFKVEKEVLEEAKKDFASERVSDDDTLATIREVYKWPLDPPNYILDPHSAVGVTAAQRSASAAPGVHNVTLATAHPAKFSRAVAEALKDEKGFRFEDILPPEFIGLEDKPRRHIDIERSSGLDGIRNVLLEEVEKEIERTTSG